MAVEVMERVKGVEANDTLFLPGGAKIGNLRSAAVSDFQSFLKLRSM